MEKRQLLCIGEDAYVARDNYSLISYRVGSACYYKRPYA
jgi:hypothetical protein